MYLALILGDVDVQAVVGLGLDSKDHFEALDLTIQPQKGKQVVGAFLSASSRHFVAYRRPYTMSCKSPGSIDLMLCCKKFEVPSTPPVSSLAWRCGQVSSHELRGECGGHS